MYCWKAWQLSAKDGVVGNSDDIEPRQVPTTLEASIEIFGCIPIRAITYYPFNYWRLEQDVNNNPLR